MRKLTGILTAFVIGIFSSAAIAETTCPSNIVNYVDCTGQNPIQTGSTTKTEAEKAAVDTNVSASSYAELEEKYKKALEEYNTLKAQLEKEEQELAMLKAREADLLKRYNLLSQEVAELKKEIEYRKQLEAKIAALKAKLKKAESKVEKLRRAFMALPKSYRVVKGDTLWGIASKSYIYNDPWQWPLIYKANRDQIKNPHLIYPNQVFAIPRNITAEEVIEARKEALRTPPPPGVKPKKVGPVRAEDVPETATDYFLFMHE